jgi:acetyl-CoA C-acetyltransferase
VIIGNMEHFEGINLSDLYPVEGSGGYGKPGFKVATGGSTGTSLALAAYYMVASGLYDRVMAVGWELLSASAGETTTGIVTAFDPIYERPTLAGAISALAIVACDYIKRYRITSEQSALAMVKARQNAAKNPHAHLKKPVTVEEVLASPMLSYPIRLLDMCPTSDGACAVIFASERGVRASAGRPAWVRAVASCHNHTYLGDTFRGSATYKNTLQEAARLAYRKAGISRPRDEIDVAEVYSPCTFAELEWLEDLGFCGPGEGGSLVESGATEITGDIPINPSGGVLCTNPIGATGLIRVAEAAIQVRGEGDAHQVPDVRTAMATGFGGSFWNEILILDGRKWTRIARRILFSLRGGYSIMKHEQTNRTETEYLTVSIQPVLPYRYSAGIYGSRFLEALKDRKILGSRCSPCGMVLVPPRIVCARCLEKMEEFIELPPTGTLTSYTQVTFPFLDPFTGELRPIPYCYGMIRLDGADNTLQFFLEEKEIQNVRIGLRLRAVFREKREGNLRDILFFRTDKGSPDRNT